MSSFRTPVPVPLEQAKALLPKGAFIESIEPGVDEVVITWCHDGVLSPLVLSDFPLATLKAKKLPAGVRFREEKPKPESKA